MLLSQYLPCCCSYTQTSFLLLHCCYDPVYLTVKAKKRGGERKRRKICWVGKAFSILQAFLEKGDSKPSNEIFGEENWLAGLEQRGVRRFFFFCKIWVGRGRILVVVDVTGASKLASLGPLTVFYLEDPGRVRRRVLHQQSGYPQRHPLPHPSSPAAKWPW